MPEMASKRPFLEEDFSCPICCSVFSNPVLLLCGHSGCKECIENYWKVKKLKECPLCRKVSITKPPPNLALRNLCHAFLDYQKQLEELCEVHHDKLSLFCDDDERLVCERCRDFGEHKFHTFRPICEVAEENKIFFRSELNFLSMKMVILQRAKFDCDEKTNYVKHESRLIETHIRKDFKKLHRLLDDEEKSMILELQQEKGQKLQTMREKVKKMNEDITTLADTIKDLEQTLDSRDIKFLKTLEDTSKRLKYTPKDPVVSPGELIDHAKYIGNLKYNVLSKIRKSIGHSPVVLDPNTINCQLQMSDNLTEVWNPNVFLEPNECWAIVPLPTNLERFENYPCVLGSVGFTTGTHSWDVEVKDNSFWMVGVTTESVQRKRSFGLPSDIWTIGFESQTLSVRSPQESRLHLSGYEKPKQVRVKLDMSEGQVTFSDPQSDIIYYTFTHKFGEKVFPFFYTECLVPLKILPVV
ncbi:E3 ubiquitin-protein ligase TRIM35-like [Triplophysa dalaica]|uniref:E3 ubiquitin-protein ligase TRIM35-like n=1 Tax=Triplophysa dalaica TaxID=1582913 RepID=UPI0024DF484C|nr:E3 ubiquitin-protein ligase TRIM35-like [Triplophysa dalaica]